MNNPESQLLDLFKNRKIQFYFKIVNDDKSTFMNGENQEEDFVITTDSQIMLFTDTNKLKLIPGEFNVAVLSRVEDIKAHIGLFGQFQITNIRLVWFIQKIPYTNASIGYNTIVSYRISDTLQGGSGICETLFLRCKFLGKNYEFIFSASKASQSVFRFFEISLKNYQESTFYREQRLRSAILTENNLILLKNENVMLKVDGVSNFSGDVAKIGNCIVTNLRFIWFSEIVSNFNVSIPLVLLSKNKIIETKRFGKCFFLKVYSYGVKYVYGFTINPEQKLIDFVKAFENIRLSANNKPILTPALTITDAPLVIDSIPNVTIEEDFSVADSDPSLVYLPAEGSTSSGSQIVFDKTIGLSLEALSSNTSLKDKWESASNTPLVAIDEL